MQLFMTASETDACKLKHWINLEKSVSSLNLFKKIYFLNKCRILVINAKFCLFPAILMELIHFE